ncbi:MAG TPA: hypothetical protein VG986_10035 [Pseudolabrys sp.]|nr:hypothetical protein [Pseudolabrys sp.]
MACLAAGGGALAQNGKSEDIDLRLFGKAEIDLTKGCSVALWQANRDPDRDKFAYVFVEALDRNQARQPARIKIGKDVLRLKRVATGGKEGGYKLFEYQLYRMEAEHSFVVLELKLGDIEGEAVEIEGGSLSILQPGKLPMRVSVKGGAGCYGGDAKR